MKEPVLNTVEVLVDNLNVRNGPGVDYITVKKLKKGSRWRMYCEQDGWYNVGGNQWISADKVYSRIVK